MPVKEPGQQDPTIPLKKLFDQAMAHHHAGRLQQAVACYQQLIALQPVIAEAHFNLANAVKLQDKPAVAVSHYQQAIDLYPGFASAHFNLGNTLKEQGNITGAISHYQKAITLNPDLVNAYNNLGLLYQELGNIEAAHTQYLKVLSLCPEHAVAHFNLGNLYRDRDDLKNAVNHYQQALAAEPEYARAHNNLGLVLQSLGRLQAAVDHYETALAIQPGFASAHNNLGTALHSQGKATEAVRHYQKAIELQPGFALAYRHLAGLDPNKVDTTKIKQLLRNAEISDEDAIHYHFALGELLNARHAYKKAFKHFHQGNQLKNKTLKFDRQAHMSYIDRLIQTCSNSLLKEKSSAGMPDDLPVFIVGMPRSGTTLIEQIISSHPTVHGAGELGYLTFIERQLPNRLKSLTPYPECLNEMECNDIKTIAQEYLQQLRTHAPAARYISDKMPDNFLRLGLIKILFPNARIIHCRRHPMDTCTSIYFQVFISNELNYAYNLEDIATYYLQYERLMSHWRELFANKIFEVQYEELVSEPEKISKQMLAYLDLDWDDRCLDFYTNTRPVMTASNMQVRRPLYTHSIDRWKRYGKGLEPLEKLLAKHLESMTT